MFGGIEKTINLVNSDSASDFLLTLRLCCYTEYWVNF